MREITILKARNEKRGKTRKNKEKRGKKEEEREMVKVS